MLKTGTKPKSSQPVCKKLSKYVNTDRKKKPTITDHLNTDATNEETKINDPTPKPSTVKPIEPKKNSSKILEKRINKIQSLTAVNDEKHGFTKETLEERITRQMNFPTDKKLYKKLIPLEIAKKKKTFTPISYTPTIRDLEPKLENYFTPTPSQEYSGSVRVSNPTMTSTRYYDGYTNYRRMRTWQK